ncbi:MAG: integral rane sensor hybrid histidine kinase [Rickettsiaceae bacterium]|jgi:two-component system CAI-1 autoinducer sensor kinase/phosphatase CqsS|nr:integral rane sensor hybrid histidine kinase [Rickettsiaceae bacterium]
MLNINKRVEQVAEYMRPNLIIVGLLGVIGFPSYYFLWKYLFIQPYENIPIRIVGTILFLPLLFHKYIPRKLQPYFAWYLMVACCYGLPFFFSFMLFKNQFTSAWNMCSISGLFFLVILICDWLVLLIMTIIGVMASYFLILFLDHQVPLYKFQAEQIPVYSFILLGSVVVHYKNKAFADHKLSLAKSLSSSIAHEMRNPLNSIKFLSEEIKNLSKNISEAEIEKIKLQLFELNSSINNSINRANDVINITLNDIKEQKIDPSTFNYLTAHSVIKTALSEYGYRSEKEKGKVKFLEDEKDDFIFKGDETLLIYILFNLIKNSLYYSNLYPDFAVTIRIHRAKTSNQIIVKDNGPGIPKEKLKSIFEAFNTAGKTGGTGLGLPFCKRTMKMLGGDIFCRSELEKHTEFVLSFPLLGEKELEKAKQEISLSKEKSIKVLLVDDQVTNLKTSKLILEKGLENITCDIATNGKEALALFCTKNNKSYDKKYYDFILTDIEMPVMDGFELAREIRKIDNKIPILAYTSVFNYKIKETLKEAGIDDYLIKPISRIYLIKTLCKWSFIKHRQDDHIQAQMDTMLKEVLHGKRLLIADDEAVNCAILKKFLNGYGIEVESVDDGDKLCQKYIYSQNYDLIITDINMKILNGDEAAQKIREFEVKNNIENPVPIIAYSGDGGVENIHKFLRSGMDDYFIKGDDVKNLIDNIVFWIVNRDDGLGQLESSQKQNLNSASKDYNSYQVINGRIDNHTLIEVKSLFVKDAERLLENIRKSWKEKNMKDFYFHSHAFKGIAGNIGAERLYRYLTYINDFSKKEQWPEEENWIETLEGFIKEVFDYLKAVSYF